MWRLLVQLNLSDSHFLQVPTATERGRLWQRLLSCCSAALLRRGELLNFFTAQQECHLKTKHGSTRTACLGGYRAYTHIKEAQRDGKTQTGQNHFPCFLQRLVRLIMKCNMGQTQTIYSTSKVCRSRVWLVKYNKKWALVITTIYSTREHFLFMKPTPYLKSCSLLLKILLNSLRKLQ